jgi:hypothetical protein
MTLNISGAFQNRGFRRVYGLEREREKRENKSHNEQLHNLYSSPNILRVIK